MGKESSLEGSNNQRDWFKDSEKLEWEQCYNEYSRSTNLKAPSTDPLNKVFFKILSHRPIIKLIVSDSYTGDTIKIDYFYDMQEAINLANIYNRFLLNGADFSDLTF